jgi:hypothetical protein
MDTHPDALTCGDSRCPPVLLRLTHVLHDAAHPAVRPGRAHCGTTVTNLRQRRPEGRICGTRLMIPHGPDAPRWLFPGRVPGQPIDNHSLTNRLNRHGISARPARNGALMALAADLPAAIIADLLGMHINTAIRWVKYAGRDWADYLAAVR